MTFQYLFQNVTDVKTGPYTMDLFELVQYDTTLGGFIVTLPNDTNLAAKNSSLEHGAVIGFKNTEYEQNPLTLDATPNLIEDNLGRQLSAIELDYELRSVGYYYDKPNTVWRRFGESEPFFMPEPWIYSGADIPVAEANVTIPLTFQTYFLPTPIFFQQNGDNLECVRKFSGFFDMYGYVRLNAGANNRDGVMEIELWTASSATILQGHGMVASASSPRQGDFYEQRFLSAMVLCSPGDVIGMRASDLGGLMTKFVTDSSGVVVRPI